MAPQREIAQARIDGIRQAAKLLTKRADTLQASLDRAFCVDCSMDMMEHPEEVYSVNNRSLKPAKTCRHQF